MSILNRNVWCILGLPFDAITLTEATQKIAHHTDQLFLTTPNLNFLITSSSDPLFFQSVIQSHLVVADGMPIIWIAKLLGLPLKERVAGSDIFTQLSTQQNDKKISVFFFGGQEGIAEQASQALNKSSHGMTCCGFYDPGFVDIETMSHSQVIAEINQAHPDFLVVALGAKKGQHWIQKNRKSLNASTISHLGAVINFVAGHIERAPLFWQQCGLEWLWRIRQEPSLWRRYFFDGLTFARLLLFKVFPLVLYDHYLKHSDDYPTPFVLNHQKQDNHKIVLIGSLSISALDPVKHCFNQVIQNKEHLVVLDCLQLCYIDSAFIGTLLLFQSELNVQNRELFLHNVPKRILSLLSLNNVLHRFQLTTET